jgi:hypothetical protein
MVKHFLRVGICVSALGGTVVAVAQDVPWKVTGGVAVVQFWPDNVRAYGLEITSLKPTAFGNWPMEGGYGFQIQAASDLKVMTENQAFGYYMDGNVRVKGGFAIRSGSVSVPVFNLTVKPTGPTQSSPLAIRDGLIGDLAPHLNMSHSITYLDIDRRVLTMGWADMTISREAAMALGKPQIEGLLIGGFTVFATVSPSQAITPGGGNGGNGGGDNTNADVNLFNMSGLTSMGRDGVAYPNGITGMATLTTSCNKGSTNIDWFSPMNERHPVIVQDLFRVRLGRIEQIGSAYLKHGFFATNTTNGACGVGVHPGTGTLLGPGLTDTYGTGNNGDRFYLGPRSEVNPFTGHWTAWGSFFDVGTGGAVPDGQRSLTSGQAGALPAHKNRIEVRDQDLIIPGGESRQYLYQSFYLCEQEINLANQIGTRQANIAWNGSSWACADNGAFIPDKAAIEQYVTMINAAKNVGAGDVLATVNRIVVETSGVNQGWVYVACNPIRLGGGLWQYELSVFNYTSDRQIRELKVPMMTGMTVSSIGFRDSDQNGGNDWTSSYANGEIVWSTQTFAANPNANSLKYGGLYNFTFTTNVAPTTNAATVGLFKPGTGTDFPANVMCPPNGKVAPSTISIILGVNGGGNVASIANSDNSYFRINEDPNLDAVVPCQVVISGTSPIVAPGTLKLDIESAGDLSGRFQITELWNWNTSQWEVVDTGSIGTNDTTRTANVSGTVSRFVNSSTREMKARLSMDRGAVDDAGLAFFKIDLFRFTVGL